MICADHGPAVSGAHNAIVCARAGKDVVDSLASGLLTIGPRFGGALDGAAELFTKGFDSCINPSDFVTDMNLVTADFISDLNDIATTAIIADLDLLATSDFISDLNEVEGIKRFLIS